MLIIVEGSDNTGKTTLCKRLQRDMRSAYVHHGPLPEWWSIFQYLPTCLPHAVYDRFYWSSWAYQTVLPQPLHLTIEDCVSLDAVVKQNFDYESVLLYSSDPSHFVRDEMLPDPLLSIEDIMRVNERYAQVAHHFDHAIDISKGFADYEWIPSDRRARFCR